MSGGAHTGAEAGGRSLALRGLHHVSCITADAQRALDFYVGLLGLRLVKRTVNFDDPRVYHLYFGDEAGSPGSLLTFFEYRSAARGRTGPGAVARLRWRVRSEASIASWSDRLGDAGIPLQGDGGRLRFADPEGLEHELVVDGRGPDTAEERALGALAGAVARTYSLAASAQFLEPVLGFAPAGDGWCAGDATYAYEAGPATRPVKGAGSVHHIAWAVEDEDELERWRLQLSLARAAPTPVVDRQYFHSVYFREPSGVLFELATLGPGFAVDEPAGRLGEELRLPPRFELLRGELARTLTPLRDPRAEVRR